MAITVGNSAFNNATASPNTVSLNNNGDTVIGWEWSFSGGGPLVPTSVTYGGVAMTLVSSSSLGNFSWSEWILTVGQGALTGTNNMVATYASNPNTTSIAGVAYTGVNQTTPNRAATNNSSTGSSNPSVTPATQSTGDLCVAQGLTYATTITSGGSQTQDVSNQNTAGLTGSQSVDHAAAPSAAFTWTGGGTVSGTDSMAAGFALIAAIIAPVGVGARGPMPRQLYVMP